MDKIFIFWHKNPDTDTILSSIVYETYLKSKWIDAQAIALGEWNNETKFILNELWIKYPDIHTTLPESSNVILVDHNESTQTIDNINQLEIIWVIDHHKFWNFNTNTPLFIRADALCSTCSVIYWIFLADNYSPDKTTAILMISAILSDSLLFKSPTTTPRDKQIVQELNKIAQIENIEEYAMAMFNAKSDLWNINIQDLIKLDYKEFDFNWTKTWIWVIETVNPSYALWRKNEIIQWLKDLKQKNWLDLIYLSIVDILKENNKTIIIDKKEKEIIKNIYWVETIENIADIGNRISRKKQVIPEFTQYFNK